MKHLKTLLFATALFIGSISFTNAQSKVAHINTQELVEAMPKMKAAQAELEKLAKTYEADIQTMVKEYQNKTKQYDAEASTKTDEENQKRLVEVQGMQQSIGAYQKQAQEDLAKKEAELMKPIYDEARAAIQKVAKAQGFNYVLDSMNGQGVLYADGTDLLPAVKKELGF
ncbi:MAG: OmpH family outer membrane protein [Flavobacteriaceae bacterium]|nr:OmpH family outer membrane protein [Flavobacteriaceae bacterium]